MSVAVRERPARAPAPNGGGPARRAVIRWAWRLLRREWRQQLLILALITVAVAATFVGSAVAVNTPTPAGAGFGTATDMATFSSLSPHVAAEIAALARRSGPIDVIENETFPEPGSIATYSLRAQNPSGPFGRPLLSLVSGHYPHGPDQVDLTSGLAAYLHLRAGDLWRAGGQARRVTGIVANPQDLLDEFALVAPGQVRAPTEVTVLFDARGVIPRSLRPDVTSRTTAANANVINPMTISLAAAVLGMLLIALVSVAGFTVLAQRRLRSIGMLGAQGATDASVRLVVSANGFATGVVGAVAGFVLGLAAWLAYRPAAEASAHHVIGTFQLPWLVIFVSMALAVLAAYLAAVRPAWAIARVPIVAALAGRPPAPRQARRLAGPVGAGLLVLAFFLIGLASAQATSTAAQPGNKSTLLLALVVGLIVLCVGVVLVAPTCLALLARVARRAPVVVRLAVRDLARYRVRSGAALGAISLSVLVAVIICVVAAARFGNPLDWAGPNLAPNQLVVYPQAAYTTPGAPCVDTPGGCPTLTGAQLAGMADETRGIAASLGSRDIVRLETTDSVLQRAAAGRDWDGAIYVATPQLLRAYGITAAQASQDADFLTMRPGLASLTKMQFLYGARKFGPGRGDSWPCPPSSCLANPRIEEVSVLPSGTSAPNTVITEHAVRQFHLKTTTAGWLIQTPASLTAGQISAAQHAAAAAGLTVETRNSIPSVTEILDVATVFGMLLALGILAMSVGLVRSETASSLRTLTATGASGTARRAISAATAGALALTGAVVGTVGGYVAAIGFFRTSQLDTLSSLASVPVANLLLILVGLPLIAVTGGWLLAGREPSALGRRPLE
ncbi:MAG TPA: FtsX-like permease family protein [Streptosporangiaceae bacterium]|jgi:putative ABC transport system permease protein|nr:FtsX-like permease family protein [Streptosporangiaceae bacterium]